MAIGQIILVEFPEQELFTPMAKVKEKPYHPPGIDASGLVPWELPELAPEEVMLANRLCQRAKRLEFMLEGQPYVLRLLSRPVIKPLCLGLRLSVEGKCCRLLLDQALCRHWLSPAVTPRHLREMPAQLACVMIEAAFQPVITACECLVGASVSVEAPDFGQPPDNAPGKLGFQLTNTAGEGGKGILLLDRENLPLLLDLLARRPVRAADYDVLPVPARFEVGRTRLSAGELHDLEEGDLILADECWLAQGHVRLRFGPGLLLDCAVEDQQVVILSAVEETMMKDDQKILDFRNLQVELVFDIGEKTIPLAELKTIQPGYVFQLDNTLAEPVIIRANGLPIGKGDLMKCGDRMAVRVTRLTVEGDGKHS